MPYVISSVIALVVCTFLGYQLPAVLTYILIGIVSLFLICLVLIQRGRGGGLAGAFGGVGGSSAFGTRAGDVFTRITIVTASVWIALNMGLVINANARTRATEREIGSDFLPEGIDAEEDLGGLPAFGEDSGSRTGGSTVPDRDDQELGTPSPPDEGADPGSSEAPSGLPPALDDGGLPPDSDSDSGAGAGNQTGDDPEGSG
ncbi:preprotein translocase subunit SecG [Tautonia sociabilis]|uniref:preprotein translocase subunit SecG n=1 Tax=Tautonia sociabilis TaxID=2080755 RepID=UPI0018F6505F|nr:preprotein translocase subunit SecG [Tautonia sociabilis]